MDKDKLKALETQDGELARVIQQQESLKAKVLKRKKVIQQQESLKAKVLKVKELYNSKNHLKLRC